LRLRGSKHISRLFPKNKSGEWKSEAKEFHHRLIFKQGGNKRLFRVFVSLEWGSLVFERGRGRKAWRPGKRQKGHGGRQAKRIITCRPKFNELK